MLAALYTWAATAVALIGTVLNCRKIRACFWFWIATNAMWFAWDVSCGLYSRAALDTTQLALAVWGLFEWKRLDGERKEADGDGA